MKSIFKDHFVNYCTVQRRISTIHMVNDVVGDGKFIPLIAEDLRELADMIDRRGWVLRNTGVYQSPRHRNNFHRAQYDG